MCDTVATNKWLADVPSEKQMFDLLGRATAAHVNTVSMRNDLWWRKQKYQENADGPEREEYGSLYGTVMCKWSFHYTLDKHVSSMRCWWDQHLIDERTTDKTWQILSHPFRLIRPFHSIFYLPASIEKNHHVFLAHSKDNLDSTWNFKSRKLAARYSAPTAGHLGIN